MTNKKFTLNICFLFLLIISIAIGCGGVKEKPGEYLNLISNSKDTFRGLSNVRSENLIKDDGLENDKKKSIQVIQNDSVYALVFYSHNGDSTGYYDIWENNPIDDLPFEKHYSNPGQRPMRYDVPDILLNDFKNQLSKYDVNYLVGTASIGRIDVYAHVPSYLDIDKYKSYIPVTYQMNFMQGFYEEFEVPGSYAIVKILDNKGTLNKVVDIPNFSGQKVAVTQDAKYLVYSTYSIEKDSGACVNVYDLSYDKNVFRKCTDISRKAGIGLGNESIVGFGFFDFLYRNNSKLYWLNSLTNQIYFDSYPPRFGNYRAEDFGLVKPMNGPPKDTILFSNMQSINLNR